ncbi:MAG: hypothetical protein PWP04_238 [Candidatus Atribacteria bacterium]|nr:hypothetical protein [Candidatus Atribacteria bacterium]
MPVVRIEVDDILFLKKKHPCGGNSWKVTRVGADIGIRCLTCQRFVMVPRRKIEGKILEIERQGRRLKPHQSLVEV